MNHNRILTITSLLSILFGTVHLADDIDRGMSPEDFQPLCGGHLRRLAVRNARARRTAIGVCHHSSRVAPVDGVPIIHLRGVGVGFGTTRSGGLFFIWTLLALGVTALFSVILSVRGLWSLRRAQPR